MKPLFILFVAIHLLIDLAMPSLPGAFRFNPDESAVAVRLEPVQVQDLKPALQVDVRRALFEFPRSQMTETADASPTMRAPVAIVLLPRRDPSPDRSLPRLTEDH